MKALRTLGIALLALTAFSGLASAQSTERKPFTAGTWTALNHEPSIAAGTALLLRDGTVIAQDENTYTHWWKLTPDNTGSYLNGTWSQIGSLPSNYGPLYFASEVLPNGFVLINGGEYNFGSPVWTTLGAYYNTNTNTWTAVTPPTGWAQIGDAQSIILDNGTYMLADCCSTLEAILNYQTLAWTATGTGKHDSNDEEGWTLLPGGTLITTDATSSNSELYVNGTWMSAGNTPNRLSDPSSEELGPQVLRPNGTVLATGATGYNAIYTPNSNPVLVGTWASAPNFPKNSGGQQLDIADGPGSILPDGNVLVMTSPGIYNTGAVFFEFDGTNWNTVPTPASAANDSSYYGRMLALPTGQVLFTDGSSNVLLYTPSGTYNPAWQPTISGGNGATLTHGHTYTLKGTQLNGVSNGAAYGDDAQENTYFPLVQITNGSTHHVFYANTHTQSTYGVQTGSTVISTQFDVPASIETGASTLNVVTNGIPSAAINVTIN